MRAARLGTFHLGWGIGVALAAGVQGRAAADDVQYAIFELPSICGDAPISRPRSVDGLGRVAGDSLDDALSPHAIRWDEQSPIVLDETPGALSRGWGSSPGGLVAGWFDDGGQRAAVWGLDGTMALHEPFAGDVGSFAVDVSDTGLVVGWTIDVGGLTRAAVWMDGATNVICGVDSAALAVNDAGTVVFRQGNAAFAWTEEFTAQLPDLGMDHAVPTGVAENGMMIGGALFRDLRIHAVMWAPNTYAIVDLGTFQGMATAALGINDAGIVVGDYAIDHHGAIRRALVWIDGAAHELADLLPPGHGWTLERAQAVNEAGMIVGHGTRAGFAGERGFILIPIERLLGDLDGDGAVTVADLVMLIAAWGACDAGCPADLDGDGAVGAADLVILVVNWT